ncbi:MAG: methylenetetrahydrofolate--tRNA-(uracil(54)-C(5))-methyltransferase (FADH(2)-oxidizing) TrmFO [Anaerolineales bacterium]
MSNSLIIIGGGLAGSEAAWQAVQLDIPVTLYEMRPLMNTGAHTSSDLAELVCSNSLGSNLPDRAAGLLKEELRILGSLLIQCADRNALPAGGALAVDRKHFANMVTKSIESHPYIDVIRQEVTEIPSGSVIIASGPLTSKSLSAEIEDFTGKDNLHFFDAIAPIVSLESVDLNIAFRGSRYGRGIQELGDYINCPMNEDEYNEFVAALIQAKRIKLREIDLSLEGGVNAGAHRFFEGCLPVEILARRDPKAMAFGPLRPVGLRDPRTGRRPYAVVQLRQDNLAGSIYNLVGFQTNLKFSEQRRVFRLIPGLENAEFLRYGQMHRNTFVKSPDLLLPTMQHKSRLDLFFAGQITGVEGYAGNIACGLLAGINAARMIRGLPLLVLPKTTMIGALMHYVTHAAAADFQPMKANFGIFPALSPKKRMNKKQRAAAYSRRALTDLRQFMTKNMIETH